MASSLSAAATSPSTASSSSLSPPPSVAAEVVGAVRELVQGEASIRAWLEEQGFAAGDLRSEVEITRG